MTALFVLKVRYFCEVGKGKCKQLNYGSRYVLKETFFDTNVFLRLPIGDGKSFWHSILIQHNNNIIIIISCQNQHSTQSATIRKASSWSCRTKRIQQTTRAQD